jgi:histidyl-tRNA synthetase
MKSPRLVRGLDYYMRTTFEVVHGALGAQNSVLGGGRYDGLAESLGSKVHSPGIGFSIGEDRLVMSVEGEQKPTPLDLFMAPLGEPALRHAGMLARDFRRAGIPWNWWKASSSGPWNWPTSWARVHLIIGDDEIAAGRYALKNMASGDQQKLTRDESLAVLAAAKE